VLQDLFNKSRKVPFSDFVTYALYSENGYYRKGSHVEKNGDFLTSPLVSRAYGETLASFFLTKVIHNRSDKISLVELGPNDGRLMSSVVDYIKKSAPNIYQKLEIILVEQNINIHKNIANLLSNHKEKLSICATITDIEKKNNETFLFCNEFFDALTFERCVLKENILYIVNIEKEKKNISEVLIKAGDSLIRKIEEYDLQIEENFYFEFPILEYEKYFYELSKKFSSLHVLVNDYGEKSDFFHSSPDPHGTCRCFYKHKVSRDFYNNIFDQDITYDVNFELLSLVAKKYGFKETGFYSQSDFLLSNNILDFIPSQMIEDSNQSLRDFKKLVSPNAFGEKFKFIIFKLNEK
jgi:SAM-dependent MidA family methyltransferase